METNKPHYRNKKNNHLKSFVSGCIGYTRCLCFAAHFRQIHSLTWLVSNDQFEEGAEPGCKMQALSKTMITLVRRLRYPITVLLENHRYALNIVTCLCDPDRKPDRYLKAD